MPYSDIGDLIYFPFFRNNYSIFSALPYKCIWISSNKIENFCLQLLSRKVKRSIASPDEKLSSAWKLFFAFHFSLSERWTHNAQIEISLCSGTHWTSTALLCAQRKIESTGGSRYRSRWLEVENKVFFAIFSLIVHFICVNFHNSEFDIEHCAQLIGGWSCVGIYTFTCADGRMLDRVQKKLLDTTSVTRTWMEWNNQYAHERGKRCRQRVMERKRMCEKKQFISKNRLD